MGERLVVWIRARTLAVDCVVAALLAAACGTQALMVRTSAGDLVLSLLLIAALAVRRVRPEICLAMVSVFVAVQWLTVGSSSGALPADIAVPVAVHAAAAYGTTWANWSGLAVALAEAVVAGVMLPLLPSSLGAHLLVGGFFAASEHFQTCFA